MQGPIFIVSAMGTGSTLLRLILDSHERIAVPHETGFMRIYNAMKFVPFKWSGRYWATRLGWSKEELDEEARKFFDRIFMRYATENGKVRWGEKTPQHTWHIVSMKHLFPDSVFVAIVRHPGAATASNMRRFGHSAGWGAHHVRRYYKEIARQASLHPNRVIILRYEDLVQQTEPLMRELLDWLGEPWSPSVLEHHRVQGSRDHHRIEGETRADEAVDSSRVAKWAKDLKGPDRRLIRQKLRGIGEFYGYSFDDPEALEPLGDPGSLLFGGEEVRERIKQFPQLKIEERGPSPLVTRLYHPRDLQVIENPYAGGHRFVPGEGDVLEGPPPGPARRAIGSVVSRLPGPIRQPLTKATRKRRRPLGAGAGSPAVAVERDVVEGRDA